VEFGPVETTMEVMYPSDGTVNAAEGVRGGLAGAPARQFKRGREGKLVEAPACGRVVLEPGETIVSRSCGGGGYGPPRERDPARVAHDVAEGWVTPERARAVYGVVTATTGGVDQAATAAERNET
jgi:N-methylhydantoinase B